jgi:hypothetical protein
MGSVPPFVRRMPLEPDREIRYAEATLVLMN